MSTSTPRPDTVKRAQVAPSAWWSSSASTPLESTGRAPSSCAWVQRRRPRARRSPLAIPEPAAMATSISLDGSSSDLARQFYYRAKAGDATVGQVTINAVPDGVQSRLDDLKLDWSKLPGVAQRALLWDSGYAVNVKNDAVQMWTLGDNSMSTLALTLDEYEDAGCLSKNCTQPDNSTLFESWHCNGAQMNKAAKCVVQEFDDSLDYNAAMWGVGGDPEGTPTLRMSKHDWTDNGTHYVVMALHTVAMSQEPGWDECPSSKNGGYGSLVFPCRTSANLTAANEAERKAVEGSQWVDDWLKQDYAATAAAEDSGGFDMILLVPIVLGALLLLALIGLAFYCRRKRRRQRAQKENDRDGESPYYAPSGDKNSDQRETLARPTVAFSEDMTMSTYAGADQTIQFPAGYGGDFVSAGSNTTLKVLLTSEFLVEKRIPLEKLIFEKALSKGANGEVWVCDSPSRSS
ncbi:unnamed protein product [Phytophthora fragariaefolia]|uniref:Unnamed protein product n=1 Tax=Phytophthora fragariaefolia TaxID=1490495 RepID=A0A9W6XDV4_9STRA|nr:unnamed protein product [Phytophthora fragariaefolia]